MRASQIRRAPHIGTVEEYASCFREYSFTETQRCMLVGHAKARNLSMREIAALAGYSNFRAANANYGKLARKIRESIGLDFEKYHVSSLVDFIGTNLDGEVNLCIHDEVVDGLRRSGHLL